MTKISINLLPQEFTQAEVEKAKFYKIQAIGVGITLVMIFLASSTVALRILQSNYISQVQSKLSETEGKVVALKDRQASLVLLKNRLSTIGQNLEERSKQNNMYNLLDKLIPQSISITSLSVDKVGNAVILALVPDSNTLDSLIKGLTTRESNKDKIKGVLLENINRGRDGIFRISLKITAR